MIKNDDAKEGLSTNEVNTSKVNLNSIAPCPNTEGKKMVGQFILGKSLGQGTFGKVKLGTHSITGEKV